MGRILLNVTALTLDRAQHRVGRLTSPGGRRTCGIRCADQKT